MNDKPQRDKPQRDKPHQQLDNFLADLDDAGAQQVVIRWVDETRPVPDGQTGYTVGRVCRATVTGQGPNGVRRETFEGVGHDDVQRLAANYRFEALFRCDNLTR